MSALIWCPFPDRETARSISGTLLDEGLIACANLIGPIESLFIWEGERGEAAEFGALMKTDARLLEAATERLGVLHPYDIPAIMGWRCDAVPQAASEWLAATGAGESQ